MSGLRKIVRTDIEHLVGLLEGAERRMVRFERMRQWGDDLFDRLFRANITFHYLGFDSPFDYRALFDEAETFPAICEALERKREREAAA
jgi:hypothetical protein